MVEQIVHVPNNLKPGFTWRLFCVRFFDKNGCGKVAYIFNNGFIVIKVTLLLKMTVSSCFHSDTDILNLFKAKSERISLRFFIAAPILLSFQL